MYEKWLTCPLLLSFGCYFGLCSDQHCEFGKLLSFVFHPGNNGYKYIYMYELYWTGVISRDLSFCTASILKQKKKNKHFSFQQNDADVVRWLPFLGALLK